MRDSQTVLQLEMYLFHLPRERLTNLRIYAFTTPAVGDSVMRFFAGFFSNNVPIGMVRDDLQLFRKFVKFFVFSIDFLVMNTDEAIFSNINHMSLNTVVKVTFNQFFRM
jgi:hypothetical protein